MASSYSRGPAQPAPPQPDTQTRTSENSRLLFSLLLLILLAIIIPYIINMTSATPAQAGPFAPNQQQPGQLNAAGNVPANATTTSSASGFALYSLIFLVILYIFVSIVLFSRFGMGAIAYYKRISPLMWMVTALVTAGIALRLIEGMQTLADIFIALAVLAFVVVVVSEFSPELKNWWAANKKTIEENIDKDEETTKK